MTKHTPDQKPFTVAECLDIAAYRKKDPANRYVVEAGHDCLIILADRIAELEAEVRRAFDMLGLHGVPEIRTGTVSNGIDVLATRYRKDSDSLRYELAAEREKALKMYNALGGILEDDSPYVSLQDQQSRWKDRMEVARDAVQAYEDHRKNYQSTDHKDTAKN